MELIPAFKTERLLLKGLQESDIPSYQKHFANYDVISHLSRGVPWPYPEDGVEQFFKNIILPNQGTEIWAWGLFLKDNPNEVIGAVELRRIPKCGHRGFWLAKEHWGKGYMVEALYPITDYAFEHLGFEKLQFSNAVGNTQSRRIKEKMGAHFLGVGPASFVNPDFTQAEAWEITRESWSLFKKSN